MNQFFTNDYIQKIQNDSVQFAASILGQVLSNLWSNYKVYIIIFFLLFFIIKFKEKGVGSVLYHLIYLGVLGITILIKGWIIVFNDYFQIIALIAYMISFSLTSIILKKFGIWS